MSSSSIFIILAIVVYLVGMILIGYRHSKGTSTSSDFYLGGRKLGPVVAAMSTEASDMSAYLLMGVPGLALFCGVAEAGWTAIGLAAGIRTTFQSASGTTPSSSRPSARW